MNLTIEEAVPRLLLPDLARRLAVAAEIPDRDGKTVSCWFPERHPNGDRRPSFNLHSGLTRFKCFSCGIEGRAPDLIAHTLGIPVDQAIKRFLAMAGGVSPDDSRNRPLKRKRSLELPPDLNPGTEDDWSRLAQLRGLTLAALDLASAMGVLRFGTVHGFPCWILTDESKATAEARRLDGLPFPAVGSLRERKAHTLPGSSKAWPVGLRPTHSKPDLFQHIFLVEGGPDLLAAYHFAYLLDGGAWLPVTMLGRNCSIAPEALPHFRSRTVKIFPHADPDGGGLEAAKRWAEQIAGAGAMAIDGFSFAGLHTRSGAAVNDLNDCAYLSAEDQSELAELFS
ncbi:MAG: hypothetical protein WD342_19230 [Verrucomicrobiales bacterium]